MTEQKMEYVRDHSENLNYKYDDYNNYQSWSNKNQGNLVISSIDTYNNILTKNFDDDRLQKMPGPFQTFGDTNLSWVQTKNKNEFYSEYNPNDNEDLYKKFVNNDKQHNEYTSAFPHKFIKN
tara:strand:- start:14 stop:379 length:366 start_codon:yes stop_codon:yes gene_type:complete